jgi:hypothetical protein
VEVVAAGPVDELVGVRPEVVALRDNMATIDAGSVVRHCRCPPTVFRFVPKPGRSRSSVDLRTHIAGNSGSGAAMSFLHGGPTGFVLRLRRVEIHRAARKRGIDVDDILNALDHPVVVADLEDDDSPRRTLVLGADTAGNMLELIALHFDDGRDLVIHAMSMRRRYQHMFPHPREPPT